MIQKDPNSHVKLPFVHQERALDVFLNHKRLHFDSHLTFRVRLNKFTNYARLSKCLNYVFLINETICSLFIFQMNLRLNYQLSVFLASLFDKILCFFDTVKNMNAFSTIQASRFQYPNIATNKMTLRHHKWLFRF
jgi:hypothetical protein